MGFKLIQRNAGEFRVFYENAGVWENVREFRGIQRI